MMKFFRVSVAILLSCSLLILSPGLRCYEALAAPPGTEGRAVEIRGRGVDAIAQSAIVALPILSALDPEKISGVVDTGSIINGKSEIPVEPEIYRQLRLASTASIPMRPSGEALVLPFPSKWDLGAKALDHRAKDIAPALVRENATGLAGALQSSVTQSSRATSVGEQRSLWRMLFDKVPRVARADVSAITVGGADVPGASIRHFKARTNLDRLEKISPSRSNAASDAVPALSVRDLLKPASDSGISIKKELATASGLAVLMTFLSFLPTYLYGRITQHLPELSQAAAHTNSAWYSAIFEDAGLRDFAVSNMAMLAVYTAMAVCSFYFIKKTYGIGNRLIYAALGRLAKHAIRLPLRLHKTQYSVGRFLSASESAAERLRLILANGVIKPINNGVVALISVAGMLACFKWQMSLDILPFIVLLSVPSFIYQRLIKEAFRRFYCEGKPNQTNMLSSILSNIENIKAAGVEGEAIAAIEEAIRVTHIEMGGGVTKVLAPYMALTNWTVNLAKTGVLAVMVLGSYWHVWNIDMGSGIIFLMLAGNLGNAIQEIYTGLTELAEGSGSVEQYREIMAEPEEDSNPQGVILPPARGGRELRLRNVEFGYEDHQPVLQIDDLRIKAGEMVAVVGPSGSGKSSLQRLLWGGYRPGKGRILVDGVDQRDLNIEALRSEWGIIPQRPEPFNGSIFQNIASSNRAASEADVWDAAAKAGLHNEIVAKGYQHNLDIGKLKGPNVVETVRLIEHIRAKILGARQTLMGSMGVSMEIFPYKSIWDNIAGTSNVPLEQVMEAAWKAGIHDDIVRLGYATQVGQQGVDLSQGQKQRLALARLWAKRVDGRYPSVIVLDEPTASLDAANKRLFLKVLEEYRGKSTIVFITHDLESARSADRIITLDGGKVAEQGTHQDLMQVRGAYYKLRRQN